MSKISKNLEVVLCMDKNKYDVEPKNYHHSKTKKSQIILGGSLRKDSNHIIHLQHKDFGNTKKWPTYTITREGVIYQHYDPTYYSDFIGIKEIDKKSISIVLENMGMITYDPNKECFVNWINEVCEEHLVYEKLWKNFRYWESYTDTQYDSLSCLCTFLSKEYDIKLDCLGYNVYDENSCDFNGIITKSNLDQNYTDLSPSFNFQKFLKMMNISIE